MNSFHFPLSKLFVHKKGMLWQIWQIERPEPYPDALTPGGCSDGSASFRQSPNPMRWLLVRWLRQSTRGLVSSSIVALKSGKRRSIKSAGILQAALPVEATDRDWLHWHDLTTDSLPWDPWAIDHPSGPQLRVSLSDLRRPYIYPPALIAEHLNAPRPPLFVHLSSTDVCCLLSHFS